MKILIQSILFVIIVVLFSLTSDRLNKLESIDNMSQLPGSGKEKMDDRQFLSSLITHHNGAISMAKEALTKSERPEIIQFANAVIAMESSNVEQAYVWRRDWYGDNNHIFIDKADKQVSMIKDLGNKDEYFDLRFLDAMIAHHEGAIAMLNDILIPTTRKEIHDTAISGVTALNQDVDTLKKWRQEWYAK